MRSRSKGESGFEVQQILARQLVIVFVVSGCKGFTTLVLPKKSPGRLSTLFRCRTNRNERFGPGRSAAPVCASTRILAIFYSFSRFREINVSLLSLQNQPKTTPNLFQRGVEYGEYDPPSRAPPGLIILMIIIIILLIIIKLALVIIIIIIIQPGPGPALAQRYLRILDSIGFV